MFRGKLQKKLITKNESSFSLEGFINPTFTNIGASSVMVDGELLATGESFKVDLPNVVLSEAIQITFLSANKNERQLSVRYGILLDNPNL